MRFDTPTLITGASVRSIGKYNEHTHTHNYKINGLQSVPSIEKCSRSLSLVLFIFAI